MRVTRSIIASGLVILLGGSLFAATGSGPKRARKSKKVKPAAQQEVEVPQPPQPPPTPEQMPAVPSRVLYTNGQLTIVAENSTLGDVLTNIHRTTGATIEIPPGANSDRIAVRLGPGEPADVVRQLLAGSRFDYIILGSPDNQSALSRVIVTPRGNAAVAMGGPPPQQSIQPQQPDNDYAPPSDVDEADQTPQPEPPQEEVNMPPEPPEGTPMPNPGSPVQQQQQGPKTPEQLLQELQRMQNRQNQPQVDRNPPPQ